jgi:hypothetical protein
VIEIHCKASLKASFLSSKKSVQPGVVVHTCNTRRWRQEDLKIEAKVSEILFQKQNTNNRALDRGSSNRALA